MIENWDIIMAQYLKDVRHRKFEWGKWDCCIFTADGIKLITGIDYMAEFRGKYSNLEEAKSVLGSNLMSVLRNKFGKTKKVGGRGDIAFKFDADGPAIGICFGNGSIFTSSDGLKIINNSCCRFFKVPQNG